MQSYKHNYDSGFQDSTERYLIDNKILVEKYFYLVIKFIRICFRFQLKKVLHSERFC